MRNCPGCGSVTRDGARFCTSCGHRFPNGDEAGSWSEGGSNHEAEDWRAASPGDDEAVNESWPSVLVAPDSPDSSQPAPVGTLLSNVDEPPPADQNFAGFWPESLPDQWPAAPAPANPIDAPAESPHEPDIHVAVAGPPLQAAERMTNQSRAFELLDMLRAEIGAIEPGGSTDLQGIIADLEVAATPPGAVAPDDLAELREAIFAARENPRDIETVVDLTRRMDALATLVIAYDRALAAIERSLAALKPTSAHGVDDPSPTSPETDES